MFRRITNDSPIPAAALMNCSRFRAWCLSTFKGYGVRLVREVPHTGLFGGVRYKRLWAIERPDLRQG